MAEDSKVAVRNARRDAIDAFKAQKKNGEITEDDLKNATKNLTNSPPAKVIKLTANVIKAVHK